MRGVITALVLSICILSTLGLHLCPRDNSQDKIYPGCNCFFEWNDANRVGNWSFEENWLQLNVPPLVGFVSIAGDNTIHVDEPEQVNELYIGYHRWDTTRVVLDEDLVIVYDDVPVIFTVRGERYQTGQVHLVITGKGFGFVSEDIAVTATQTMDSFVNGNDITSEIVTEFSCETITLTYRDAQIECNILANQNFNPFTLSVTVAANGYVSDPAFLSTFIQ